VRASRALVVVCFATIAVTLPSTAHALEAVPLPMTAPPGATVQVNVSDCPTGTTDSAAFRFRAAGGTAPAFDPSETGLTVKQISGGGGTIDFRIPTDTQAGDYVFDVFCVSEGGGVVDGPKTVPMKVALLPLSVSPQRGPHLTQVTVNGSGCPTGTTDQVFVRISGGIYEIPPFSVNDANQFHTNPNPDGSFSLSFSIPTSLEQGENQIASFCISEGGSVLAGPGLTVFVVEQGELARTGSNTMPLAVAGFAAIAIGAFLATRRRALLR
jgi:LPXTG-motif cell wall-anchored protein